MAEQESEAAKASAGNGEVKMNDTLIVLYALQVRRKGRELGRSCQLSR